MVTPSDSIPISVMKHNNIFMNTLKGLSILATACVMFTLSACSDDDDDDETTTYSIVGTWLWEKTYDYDDYSIVYYRTLIFKSDGTGSVTYNATYYEGNTSLTDEFTDYFEYSFNQDASELTVVLTDEGDEDYYAFFSTTGIYTAYVTKTQLTVESASGTEYVYTRQ